MIIEKLYLAYFTVSALLIVVNACGGQCTCSEKYENASCCLTPSNMTNFPMEKISDGCKQSSREEPSSCSKSWKRLSIHLAYHSWPSTLKKLPFSPANCTQSIENLSIFGTSTSEPEDLLRTLKPKEIINFFPSRESPSSIKELKIMQTELHHIKNGFLNELNALNVQTLEMSQNPHLKDLGIGFFTAANHVKTIVLNGNALKNVNLPKWGISNNSSKVIIVSLNDNNIEKLENNAFTNLRKLQVLSLNNNKLTGLNSMILNGCTNLNHLKLANNDLQLSKLKGDLQSAGLNKLRILDLSNNKNLLRNADNQPVDWWLSKGCPRSLSVVNLKNVNLNDENAKSLIINVTECPNLHTINLSNNDLSCIPRTLLGLELPDSELENHIGKIKTKNLRLCELIKPKEVIIDRPPSISILPTDSPDKTKKKEEPMNNSLFSRNSSLSYGQFLVILALLCIALIIIVIITIVVFLFMRSRHKRFISSNRRQLGSPCLSIDKNPDQYHIIPQGAHLLYDQNSAYLACPSVMTNADLMCAAVYPPRNKSPTSDTTINAGELPEDLTPMTNKDDTNSSSLNDSGFAQQTNSSCYAQAPVYGQPQKIPSMVASASSYFPNQVPAGPQFEAIYVPTRLGNLAMPKRPESYCAAQGLSSSCTLFPSMMSLNGQSNRTVSPPIGLVPIGASAFIPVTSQAPFRIGNARVPVSSCFRHSFVLPQAYPTTASEMDHLTTGHMGEVPHASSPIDEPTYQSPGSDQRSSD